MAKSGITIAGERSNRVFDEVVDFDATSLYPSIILSANIDTTGQVGRIVLLGENGEEIDSSLLMEAWASGDAVEIGRRWLGLPGLDELAALLAEEPGVEPDVDAALAA